MAIYPRQAQNISPESNIPEMAGVPPLPRRQLPPSVVAGNAASQTENMGPGDPGGFDPRNFAPTPTPTPVSDPSSPQLLPLQQPTFPRADGARAGGYNVPEPSPFGAPPVLAPRARADRLNVFRDLLAKFTYSLASAYAAPPGRRMGAALMGPYAYEERQARLDLQEAQELQRTAAVQQAMAAIQRQQVRLPVEIEELLARASRERGQAETSVANLPLIGARAGLVEAQTGLVGAQTERARTYVRPEGIFRMEEGRLIQVPGADTVTRVAITRELARKLQIPEELAGMELRPADINQLRPDSPNTKIYRSAEGVMLLDESTGQTTKLGDLAPTLPTQGSYTPLTDQFGQIIQFFNPATGVSVNVPFPGARRGAVASVTMTRSDTFNNLSENVKLLRELAAKHQGAIGVAAGRVVGVMRQLIDVDPEINAMFRISDNLADILLRARSGAQINEREYERLKLLVPNPRGPNSKFWSDLDEFDRELQNSIKFTTPSALPVGAIGAPGAVAPDVSPSPPILAPPPRAADRIRQTFPPRR